MGKFRRRFSLFLAVCMLAGLFPATALAAGEDAAPETYIVEAASGTVVATGSFFVDDGAAWRLYSDGTLVVDSGVIMSGGGWSVSSPWNAHRDAIRRIHFTGPITAGASLAGLFSALGTLEEITGLTYFDTRNTTDMRSMFSSVGVDELDLSSFDTSNVRYMDSMFSVMWNMDSLSRLDLSSFSMRNLVSGANMFQGQNRLRVLILGPNFAFPGNADLPAITNLGDFSGNWRNVGHHGNIDMPLGFHTLTSQQLQRQGALGPGGLGDIWVWQTRENIGLELVASGTVGAGGAAWLLLNNGRLDVSEGTINWSGGADGQQSPWHDYRTRISNINFHGPITAGPNLRGLFAGLGNLDTIVGLNQFNTRAATDMRHLFAQTSRLRAADLSSFDTRNVTNMSGMFQETGVGGLDLSGFNTANVTHMTDMFSGTANLVSLDISSFDTANVTDMRNMFSGASNLARLDLSHFNTQNATSMEQMFAGMSRLRQITLGEQVVFQGDVGVPAPPQDNTHTGRWRQVGTGTPENPIGRFVFTPWEFSNLYTGDYMVGTYVWQRGGRRHERFMQGSANSAGQWSFRPTAQITRAEVAAILVRTLVDGFDGTARTTTAFSDVEGHWAHSYIAWAADHGIILGDAGRFRPNNNVTRQEFAAMVARAIIGRENIPAGGTISSADADRIPSWATDYIYAAYSNVWMRGDTHNNFNPQNNLTRGEAATVISRALGRGITTAESIASVRSNMMNFVDVTNPDSWFYYYVAQVANTHEFRVDTRTVWTQVTPPPQPPPPPPPPRDPVNIQPLLGANFNNVRASLGAVDWTSTHQNTRTYAFDTDIIVWVENGIIVNVIMQYEGASSRTHFHFNGLNGNSTRAQVRNALGTPSHSSQDQFGWVYSYWPADRSILILFDTNDRIQSITYSRW